MAFFGDSNQIFDPIKSAAGMALALVDVARSHYTGVWEWVQLFDTDQVDQLLCPFMLPMLFRARPVHPFLPACF